MSVRSSQRRERGSAAAPWLARIAVLSAFVFTVWMFGPRALEVLAARVDRASEQSTPVELDRVGFVTAPDWMDRGLLLAVSAALQPYLDATVPILDDAAQRVLRQSLLGVPWVRDVSIQRAYPDRLRLQLDLRRPLLAVRDAAGQGLCLVDGEAMQLPWVETSLPVLFLHREGGAGTMAVRPGERCAEPRVLAGIGIAREWREQFAPLVKDCPALLEIDATNLGERWLRGPAYPEVRVKLARADGAGVVFAYDRPVDSPLPRVPVATKANVLSQVLAQHPGLAGLVAGDLRLSRRWADYLQPRAAGVRDPNEPWTTLSTPR